MSENSPNITFMLQYTEPNTDYVDYTNRSEAVELDNDLNLRLQQQTIEDMTDARVAEIKGAVPEQDLSFKDYINYMNRDFATEAQTQDRTAIFNQEANYLQTKRVDQLKKNLETAYDNGSLLWQGVVSFDNQFLTDQGLFDKESGQVDQNAIKNVIREAMPKLIRQEGLSDTAFWWGNIHLNTDNVHVHIGLSELESTRERIYYAPRQRYEYKGNFSQKSIKGLKSNIYHGLINPETRGILLRKEQVIANLRTDLLANVLSQRQGYSSVEKIFLEQAYGHLPKNKQKWRYGSNARDFAVSKFFLDKYIDSYFENEGKADYEAFLTETREFLSHYEGVYAAKEAGQSYEQLLKVNGQVIRKQSSTKAMDIDKLIFKREQDLRSRIGNRILKEFKTNIPDFGVFPEEESNIKSFSKGNQRQIKESVPNATLIKTQEAWQKLGYQIDGEAVAIPILVPKMITDAEGKDVLEGFERQYYYDISQTKIDPSDKRISFSHLKLLKVEELQQLVETAKETPEPTEKQRQELGLFRFALRQSLLERKQAELTVKQELLKKVNPLATDQPFITFKQDDFAEQLQLIDLQLKPKYRLKKEQTAQRDRLAVKHADSVKLPIEKADSVTIQEPIQRLKKEIDLASKMQDDSLFSMLKGQEITKDSYLDELQTHMEIFQLKHKIHLNNDKMARDKTNEAQYRKENGHHFRELKDLYQRLTGDDPDKVDSQIAKAVAQRFESRQYKERQELRQPHYYSQSQAISRDFMKGLSMALKNQDRGNMRAFMEKVRADERDRREEARERTQSF